MAEEEIKKASFDAVKAIADKYNKGEYVSANDAKSVKKTIQYDMENGENADPAGIRFQRLRNGDASKLQPCSNITIDEFVRDTYGFKNVKAFLYAQFGLHPSMQMRYYFDRIANTGNSRENFASVMSASDFDTSFRWLIPEVVLSYVLRGMQLPRSSAANLISGTDEVMSDEFKIPAVLSSDTKPAKMVEGQTIELGTLRFGDKTAKTFVFGKGLAINDQTMMKMSLDAFGIGLRRIGRDLMIAENIEALKILIEGETSTEAAEVVGVNTANDLTDKDIWRVLSVLEEIGYEPEYIIGNREDILNVNTLEMFRGYNGLKREGTLDNEGKRFVNPNLRTMTRSDAPTNTLVVGSRDALRRATFLPTRLETARKADSLESILYFSGSSGFYIANADARLVIDLADTLTNKPIPASLDLYANGAYK